MYVFHENVLMESEYVKLVGHLEEIDIPLVNDKCYTGDGLRNQLKEILRIGKYTSKHINQLNKLIDNKVIIPVVFHTTLLGHMVDRIKFQLSALLYAFGFDFKFLINTINKYSVMAFFHPITNKCYIFITSMSSFFRTIDENHLSYVVLHELMHYSSYNNTHGFFNIWKDVLYRYYNNVLKSILYISSVDYDSQKKLDKKANSILKQWLNLLFNIEDKKVISNKKKWASAAKMLHKFYSNMGEKLIEHFSDSINNDNTLKFLKSTSNALAAIVVFTLTNNLKDLLKLYKLNDMLYLKILLNAYMQFDKNNDALNMTMAYQELTFMSEVVAILCGSMNNDIQNKVSNTLKMFL